MLPPAQLSDLDPTLGCSTAWNRPALGSSPHQTELREQALRERSRAESSWQGRDCLSHLGTVHATAAGDSPALLARPQGEKTHSSSLPLQTCQPGRALGLLLLTLLPHGPSRTHGQRGEHPGAQSGLRGRGKERIRTSPGPEGTHPAPPGRTHLRRGRRCAAPRTSASRGGRSRRKRPPPAGKAVRAASTGAPLPTGAQGLLVEPSPKPSSPPRTCMFGTKPFLIRQQFLSILSRYCSSSL